MSQEPRIPYALLVRKPRPLLDVARRAQRYAQARGELDHAIVAAHAAGFSMREIADASGSYSHEGVRKIVNRSSSRRGERKR